MSATSANPSDNRIGASAFDAREAISGRCTLDGEPATVGGAALEFAYVRKDGCHLVTAFEWEEAQRVMLEEGGRFFTPSRPGDRRNGRPAA